ncbi:hypothetical protein IKG20_03325 [Candidatus Saccharibacteria bacterium]|nr:hypothetical protein [Candidatus Saccharibacteria bacterium]
MTVDELRERFPGIDAKFTNAYLKLRYTGLQKYVPRMGYSKFGMTPYIPEGARLHPNLQVSDADHICWLVNLVTIFEDFFGPYFPILYNYQPQWHSIMHGMIFHEIGEIEIGDLTDDGSFNREEKESLELQTFANFMDEFPEEAAKRHFCEFTEVQAAQDIKYCFDKGAFVFAHGFFKHYFDIQGNSDSKITLWPVSAQDMNYRKKIGSPRAVDLIFAHFLEHTQKIPEPRPFFIGMAEAMYRIDFNEYDPRVEGCVPGEVPPGVKQFY